MFRYCLIALSTVLIIATRLYANPYPDPDAVPKDPLFIEPRQIGEALTVPTYRAMADSQEVLRVDLDWDAQQDAFTFRDAVREQSGTAALIARARRSDPLGSYQGSLLDPNSGAVLAFESLGTGSEFRKLVRALTFRFPMPRQWVVFQLTVENPTTGAMEVKFKHLIDPAQASVNPMIGSRTEAIAKVRVLRPAKMSPKLVFAIYADGYTANRESSFFARAAAVVSMLEARQWPLEEHFEFIGVFAPSRQTLGFATTGPLPVPARDSFLGLYHPYWNQVGRWFHVVYPTSEVKFRNAAGMVPHDYALALIDSSAYWGMGNFRELTAIPANNSSFTYLLLHELGHYFGLNEEYDTGGPTELQFAPQIEEPWSQNITFRPDRASLKWSSFVDALTPAPTPHSHWRPSQRGPLGAYLGGYAESFPRNRSHIPGLLCTMASSEEFCGVCKAALSQRILFDLGL